VNDTGLQFALREWRDHLAVPVRAASLLGAAIVLAMVGPFQTEETMRLVPRFGYWVCIVVVSYSLGYFCNEAAARWAHRTNHEGTGHLVRRVLIAAPTTAIAVLIFIHLLNGLTIGYWATGRELAIIAGNVFVISSIITVIFHIADHTQEETTTTPPPILDRLPFALRAPLVAMSVEDHYVRVYTTKGDEMILMRLSDAIREVGDTAGLQVHRSHWAAFAHIAAVNRNGNGAVLTMTSGLDIPVSRSNMPAIQDAGLLPKAANG